MGPELWPVGGLGSPNPPYHFLHPSGVMFSVDLGVISFYTPHEDGEILAYSARGVFRAIWVFSLLRRALRLGRVVF